MAKNEDVDQIDPAFPIISGVDDSLAKYRRRHWSRKLPSGWLAILIVGSLVAAGFAFRPWSRLIEEEPLAQDRIAPERSATDRTTVRESLETPVLESLGQTSLGATDGKRSFVVVIRMRRNELEPTDAEFRDFLKDFPSGHPSPKRGNITVYNSHDFTLIANDGREIFDASFVFGGNGSFLFSRGKTTNYSSLEPPEKTGTVDLALSWDLPDARAMRPFKIRLSGYSPVDVPNDDVSIPEASIGIPAPVVLPPIHFPVIPEIRLTDLPGPVIKPPAIKIPEFKPPKIKAPVINPPKIQ